MLKYLAMLVLPTMAFAQFQPTSESECYPVDNRNEQIDTIRNQKEIAWCYAFTAADVLGHTFRTEEKISAADVALNYNDTGLGRLARWLSRNIIAPNDPDVQNETHQTGFSEIALNQTLAEGHCPERIFPSEEWTKMTRTESGWVAEQVSLQKAMYAISELHNQRQNLTAENLPYYFSFKNITPENFVTMLKTKHQVDFYNSLRMEACRQDRLPFDDQWKVKMVLRHKNIFPEISGQLELGRIVGLDYDSRIRGNRNQNRLNLKHLHTSSIVARRWHKDSLSCQFLVRDSYGKTCDKYDPSYECEGGQIWLSESLLYPNLTRLVYMLSRAN